MDLSPSTVSQDGHEGPWQRPALASTPNLSPPTSCRRCKQRKSRCDRRLPSCRRCEDARVTCEYPTRRKPGFAASHRQALESKIEELEAEVQSLRSKSVFSQQAANQRAENNTLPLPEDAETSTQQTASRRNTQRRRPATTSAAAAAPPSDLDVHNPNDRVFQATYPRTSSVAERKPPLDIVVSSVSTYFRYIHPWLPFLDAGHVVADLASMREPSLLHHAMFGASIPFLYDSRLDQLSSDAFWKYTKRRIFNETAEEPSYASLEASTILCLDLSCMTNGPQVWGRLAVITKLASQLRTQGGLVLRPSVQAATTEQGGVSVSRPNSLQHARLFWAIYALDSYISITTSQPACVSERDLRYFLPTREAAWAVGQSTRGQREPSERELSSPVSLFLFQLQLLDLSRQAHRVYLDYLALLEGNSGQQPEDWFDSFSQCSQALDAWFDALPVEIRMSPSRTGGAGHNHGIAASPPVAIMLHAYSHALVVYLNGLIMSCNQTSLQDLLSHIRQEAHRNCMRSVFILSDMASSVDGVMDDQLGWPFTWSVWTAARYLLATASQEGSMLPRQFESLTLSLQRMGRFWQISKKYWKLLRRAEVALSTQRSTDEADPSSILSLVADLTIPTSHLEDQFRVDPVLSRGEEEVGPGVPAASTVTTVLSALSGQQGPASTQMSDEALFGTSDDFSDVWFTTPLFASSAYHQFPGDNGNASNAWYGDVWQPPS